MTRVVALESHNANGKVRITDTKGENTTSNDINEILASLVAPYTDTIKIVWDMEAFLKPITKLLPKEITKKLNNGEKARYGDFKLFYGIGKGGVLGVDWLVREQDRDNFYTEDRYEANIYELKLYYPNETPTSLDDVRARGQFLLDTLHNMGMNPTKLSSPASIYEECVLRDMGLYRMCDMPDYALEFAEWAANYSREWRCTYQLGLFPQVWDFDLSSAYGSVLSKIPNFENAKYIKTNGSVPRGIFWGLLGGELDITADISHIVSDDGNCYSGKRQDIISTTDWACLKRWNIGTFVPNKGWFIKFDRLDHIFDQPMRYLYSLRGSKNELQERLVKNMSASCWGRFAQRIERVDHKFGDYYFPLIPSMVTSKVRCMDCDFIYSNNLQRDLISVTIDGCLSTKNAPTPSDKRFGEWRFNGTGEALILGQGFEWLLDKKPLGKSLNEMLAAIKTHPNSHAYFGLGLRFIEQSRQFDKLPTTGAELLASRYQSTPIDLVSYPKTGGDLLTKVYTSKAIKLSEL